MKTIFLRSLSIALLLGIFVAGTASAHGTPTITIQPTVVSPGGQITVTGADMEEGESFKLTLESMTGIVQLGQLLRCRRIHNKWRPAQSRSC